MLRRPRPVAAFLVRRLAAGIGTVFVASILIFVGTEVLPGNAATAILGRYATGEAATSLSKQLHLDQPAPARYMSWLSGFVQGDFGYSAASLAAGGPPTRVSKIVVPRLVSSALLAGITAAFLVPLGLVFGVIAATKAGRALDHTVSTAALVLIALPEFVTGTLLILVFAHWLHALPPVAIAPPGEGVLANPLVLVLPVLTLLAASLAQTVRMVRAGMIDVLRADYVHVARMNGLAEHVVLRRYALRNALAPTVQVIALNLTWLISGIVITESLFAYPGLGQALVQAVALRDIPFVQSVALLIAVFYAGLNIFADLIVLVLVPKLRTQQ
jgi:peptide/nickel transport system permease protein